MNTPDGPIQTPSLSFHPDGTLYGIDLNPPDDGQVYTIDPNTGTVTYIGSKHQTLRRMFGTTFTSDGEYHGVNTEVDAFYSPIDYTENGGATDPPNFVGELRNSQTGDLIAAVHTGLTTNTVTDTIFSTLGFQADNSPDEVVTIDRDTGEMTIVAEDVLASGPLVGAELNPCTGELFVVRNDNVLRRYNLVTGDDEIVGTLSITVNGGEQAVRTGNLAAKWGLDCAAGCTRTIGYYKTHGCDPKGNNENVVQSLLGSDGIWLGKEDPENPGEPLGDSIYVTESCAEDEEMDGWSAEEILDTSGPKDDDDMLLTQLLAAKLNVESGADQSAVLETVLLADRWLAGEFDADADTVEEWKDELDRYNNGIIGPGHCDDDEEEYGDGNDDDMDDKDDENEDKEDDKDDENEDKEDDKDDENEDKEDDDDDENEDKEDDDDDENEDDDVPGRGRGRGND